MGNARNAVLKAFEELERDSGHDTFRLGQVWHQVRSSTSAYKESTIRTHVVSAMCVNAPVHHANHTEDLVRVDRGIYRRVRPSDNLKALRSAGDNPTHDSRFPARSNREPTPKRGDANSEWHWEGNIQSVMVSYLAQSGWAIQSVANTSTKEHGVDIIASKDGRRILVEVKGYPSRYYVRGERMGEVKKTAPSIQARVWFADLIMSSMLNSGDEPEANIVLCLPDVRTFRNLSDRMSPSLTQLGFTVAWISESGDVDWPEIAAT